MSLFRKSHSRSLDAKGRLVLPPEYREALAALTPDARFVVTGFQGKLVAYTIEDWEKNLEQFARLRQPSLKVSRFRSKILGLAEEMTPDAQGRVRLSQPLLREAGLSKDVVLVGIERTFEIWDQARFDELETEDVSEELAASGLDITI